MIAIAIWFSQFVILLKLILAIFLGRKNWFDSRFFLVWHEFVWNKKKINSYGMLGTLPAPPAQYGAPRQILHRNDAKIYWYEVLVSQLMFEIM